MGEIEADAAPAAIGPYSHGAVDEDRIFVSGRGPVDRDSGEVMNSEISEQTTRTFETVETDLEATGMPIGKAVKSTIFVAGISNYGAVNEVSAEYMSDPLPPRSAVKGVDLPIEISAEIEGSANK